MVLDFLQRWFTGYYSIKFFGKYLSFPKLAPLMYVAFFTTAIGEWNSIDIVRYLGYSLIALGVFCFFLLRIFKKRQFNGLTKVN